MLDMKDNQKCTAGKNWAEKAVFQSVCSRKKCLNGKLNDVGEALLNTLAL